MKMIRQKQNGLPSLLDGFFNPVINNVEFTTPSFSPATNVSETSEGYQIQLSVPGFEKSDFNISLDNGILLIKADVEQTHQDENVLRTEFVRQSFRKKFQLPDEADENKVEAKYVNGILSLDIQKKEEAKPVPVRSIKIK